MARFSHSIRAVKRQRFQAGLEISVRLKAVNEVKALWSVFQDAK
jgi:hypothetical protein